jgi:ketosteroid isomerase-like protein
MGRREGAAAIRSFLEDWIGTFEDFEIETGEVHDLGDGVTLSASLQKGRSVGSTGYVQLRYAIVAVWVEGMIERFTTYPDIDEARAAAERLAEERA